MDYLDCLIDYELNTSDELRADSCNSESNISN